jgi:hypothetical protein
VAVFGSLEELLAHLSGPTADRAQQSLGFSVSFDKPQDLERPKAIAEQISADLAAVPLPPQLAQNGLATFADVVDSGTIAAWLSEASRAAGAALRLVNPLASACTESTETLLPLLLHATYPLAAGLTGVRFDHDAAAGSLATAVKAAALSSTPSPTNSQRTLLSNESIFSQFVPSASPMIRGEEIATELLLTHLLPAVQSAGLEVPIAALTAPSTSPGALAFAALGPTPPESVLALSRFAQYLPTVASLAASATSLATRAKGHADTISNTVSALLEEAGTDSEAPAELWDTVRAASAASSSANSELAALGESVGREFTVPASALFLGPEAVTDLEDGSSSGITDLATAFIPILPLAGSRPSPRVASTPRRTHNISLLSLLDTDGVAGGSGVPSPTSSIGAAPHRPESSPHAAAGSISPSSHITAALADAIDAVAGQQADVFSAVTSSASLAQASTSLMAAVSGLRLAAHHVQAAALLPSRAGAALAETARRALWQQAQIELLSRLAARAAQSRAIERVKREAWDREVGSDPVLSRLFAVAGVEDLGQAMPATMVSVGDWLS